MAGMNAYQVSNNNAYSYSPTDTEHNVDGSNKFESSWYMAIYSILFVNSGDVLSAANSADPRRRRDPIHGQSFLSLLSRIGEPPRARGMSECHIQSGPNWPSRVKGT